MTAKSQTDTVAQAVQVTDAMIEAGARAMAAADGWHRWQAYATMAKHCLIAAQPLSAVAQGSLTQEDIYANCWTTLIGFSEELTERDRKFICDQVARKVILAAQPPAAPVENTDHIDWDAMAEERLGQRPPGSSAESEPAAWQYFGGGEWHTFAKPTKEVLEFWTKPELEGGMGSKVRPLFTREPQTLSNREDKQ